MIKKQVNQNKLFFIVVAYFAFCWLFLVKNYELPIILFCVFGTLLSVAIKLKGIKVTSVYKTFLIISSTILFYTHFGTFKGILPGISLLAIMAIVKSLELNSKRDFYIFLLIVELIMIGNFLILESILYVGFIFVSTFILFYLLYLINTSSGYRPTLDKKNNFIYSLFFYSIFMTIPLFFIFPRLNFSFFNLRGVSENAQTGFAKELRPGEISKLTKNSEKVFTVSFLSKAPPRSQLYWRGEILTLSDGINWRRAKYSRKKYHVLSDVEQYRYNVFYNESGSGFLFNLANVSSIEMSGKVHSTETHQGIFIAFPMSSTPFSYQATTSKVVDVKELVKKEIFLETEFNVSPEVLYLAKSLDAKSLKGKIENITKFILNEDFSYTLEPGKYERENFLKEFLINRKKGFCGHYSSAFASLMRLMNIPSRVVTGFQGGSFNEYGNFYSVRSLDAHTWIEYWNPAIGWVRFDPTNFVAPDRISEDALDYFSEFQGVKADKKNESNFIQNIYYRLESSFFFINSKFLNYDWDSQKAFFKKLLKVNVSKKFLGILTFVFIFLSLIVYTFIARRNLSQKDEVVLLYERFKRKLLKKGIAIKDSDGPIDILQKIDKFLDKQEVEELSLFIKSYVKWRYQNIRDEKTFQSLKKG